MKMENEKIEAPWDEYIARAKQQIEQNLQCIKLWEEQNALWEQSKKLWQSIPIDGPQITKGQFKKLYES